MHGAPIDRVVIIFTGSTRRHEALRPVYAHVAFATIASARLKDCIRKIAAIG